MLSLVAYNSSDESDDDANEGENNTVVVRESLGEKTRGGRSGVGLFSSLPPPKMSTTAKVNRSLEEEELSLRDGKDSKMPKNPFSTNSNQKGIKQPVKIKVPSLSEFQDDEPSKKKMKFSKSGSGLIGLLPSPHNALIKDKKLIPPSVLSKPLPKRLPESVLKYFKSPKPTLEDEHEDEAVSADFFSLSTPTETKENPGSNSRGLPLSPIADDPLAGDRNEGLLDSDLVHDERDGSLTDSESHQEVYAAGSDNIVASSPPLEISGDFYKDEGFMRLQGKRNRKMEDVSIIDVHADQHLPDSTLYLKSLSEEQPYKPSHNSIPSAQHRRKHQITYLAYQAKERELELKNQWANNRMTRYQTQAKYGF